MTVSGRPRLARNCARGAGTHNPWPLLYEQNATRAHSSIMTLTADGPRVRRDDGNPGSPVVSAGPFR